MRLLRETYTLQYDVLGDSSAPTVCLVHSLAADSGMWNEQIRPLLEGGYQVLRFDVRGHGGSSASKGAYSMPELAADIASAIDALGFEGVHYVGLSIGGMIGLGLALEHESRFESMMICDALAAAPPNAASMWQPRIDAARNAGSLQPVADATIERWLSPAFKAEKPKRWREIYNTIVATDVTGYIGCVNAVQTFNYGDRLGKIRLPTLVLCGSNDPGAPPAASQTMANTIPGGQYVEVENSLHFPNIEQPEAFNRAMLTWLDARR
jgi:3-oxoadipate enol-lactonase